VYSAASNHLFHLLRIIQRFQQNSMLQRTISGVNGDMP
jgi:hypothetical protein